MRIEILNRQKIKRINHNKIRQILERVLALISSEIKHSLLKDRKIRPYRKTACRAVSLSVILCDNDFIKALNKQFLKRNYSTDVIAFPLSDELEPCFMGEVVVSVEKAVSQARVYKSSWQNELNLYLIHGILHLIGYRDSKKKERLAMEHRQQEILSEIL
ncbi:MAG: rRNA maturation RNase YbeY [Candidatus Omnitrophota bacterium]